MRKNFAEALKFVLDHENVYAAGHHGDYKFVVTENVSNDAGGRTRFGIDQASHPGVDVDKLTFDQARDIYLAEWIKFRCDDLPDKIDAAVFDAAINCGQRAAGKFLQRAINLMDRFKGHELTVDGEIGPKTLALAFLADPAKLLEGIKAQRLSYYAAIAMNNPTQQKFLKGWRNRQSDLDRFLA